MGDDETRDDANEVFTIKMVADYATNKYFVYVRTDSQRGRVLGSYDFKDLDLAIRDMNKFIKNEIHEL